MRPLLLLLIASLGFSGCALHRQAAVSQTVAQNPHSKQLAADRQPAQAQTSLTESGQPSMPFSAAETMYAVAETKPAPKLTDALASNRQKTIASALRTSVALPKSMIKAVQNKIKKIEKKRRPQGGGEILGLSPVLFFALLAALVGVILLFVAGKSQFFSILTLVLLIGGLLTAVAAFLEII